ncbi:hypothetical protein EDD11_006853 [Mortierella claussenii]|nr:hypothetical protein EDD11_006853 [Mortierella claussenii]
MIFSEAGYIGSIWEVREALLRLLKEKKRPVEREEEEMEGDEELLHFMFLKKAMEEVLVSIVYVKIKSLQYSTTRRLGDNGDQVQDV